MGAAAGGGTGYGATKAHYTIEVKRLETNVQTLEVQNKTLEDINKENEKHIQQQREEINRKQNAINARDRDATQFINTMNHATANRKRVDWCYTLSPGKNTGRAKHHYGTYNGQRWEIKYDEWGCDPKGNY